MPIFRLKGHSVFVSTYVVSADTKPSTEEVDNLLKSEILAEFNQEFRGESVFDIEEITKDEYLAMWKENDEGMSDEEKLEFIKPITTTVPAEDDILG
jgi:hypothetical protein